MEVTVISARADDFALVARLHSASITEGFLSTLGLRFLTVLYRGIQTAPRSGVLVAKDGGTILGFVAYTTDVATCYRWVLARRLFPLGMALLPSLLKPSVHARCLQTLLYPFRARDDASPEAQSSGRRPELLSMAVSDRARGQGIGKQLVRSLDEQFRRLEVESYVVVTYAKDERSNGFYRSCGCVHSRSFSHHGKPMNEYLRTLNS